MLELRFIRENALLIEKNLAKRHDPQKQATLAQLLAEDERHRLLSQELEKLRARRNAVSKEINEAKKAKQDASGLIEEAKLLPSKIKQAEEQAEVLRVSVTQLARKVPNLLHDSVPYGKDDTQNQTVREWGGKKVPDFGVQSHVDLIEKNDWVDLTRAAKISGARTYFLKNDLVLLDLALQRFALDSLAKKGFTPVLPPFFMRREPYEGVTDLADFENVMYKLDGEDSYLIATSEHPVAAMHLDEVLSEEQLPLKYAGVSSCFRKEAGAHGKDTKGIFRVHQFSKVEQFVFCKPEDSWAIHEQLLKNAEDVFQALEIPYRVVNICTGDIGIVASKKYDIEAWMPAQGTYREVVSCSNCLSYQSVPLNIKYGKYGGQKEYVHTLNSTALANPRATVAILENHQTADGTVKVPKALQPYVGKKELAAKI